MGAETTPRRISCGHSGRCFNEDAPRWARKPYQAEMLRVSHGLASMRPRHEGAEINHRYLVRG